MAAKKNGADREIDLHGYTAAEARARLNTLWATREWHGLQRVRVIHGTGSVLHALVKLWCEEKGIAWTVEPRNPGVTILHPGQRLQALSAPPHRPLHPLKHHRPAAKNREAAAPPDPDDNLSDEERMAQEFARLGVEQTPALLKHKRSTDPGSEPPFVPPAPAPAAPRPDSPPDPAGDPMEEEFARLEEDDALTLFKRKRDLLPSRKAPESARTGRAVPHHPALPPPPAPDLMAQEFARLGEEPPQVTRKRKGGRG